MLRSSECYLEVARGLNGSHLSRARVRMRVNVWSGKCVCGRRRQKALSSIITALLCVCVCVITLLLHTAMFIITQKNTSLIHVITTSPPLATLSNQPFLSLCLSFSVKVGLISIKQDLSCNPVKWACDGNNPAQGKLTPCESVSLCSVFREVQFLPSDRGNAHRHTHTLIYGGSVCVCGENISFSPSRYSSSCQRHLTSYLICENVFENEDACLWLKSTFLSNLCAY